MAKSTTTTKAARTTKTTEIVLGQAAQHINKGVNELKVAAETITKLADQIENLTLEISNKENDIADLDIKFNEMNRAKEIELQMNFKSNSEKVVLDYLLANNKVAVTQEYLSQLQQDLDKTKANAESETKKAVAIVTANLTSKYESDIKLLQSENKAIAADNQAKIGTLDEKNKFLEAQVTKLYAQLDAERAASIERAKAGSVGSINVTGGGK